MSAFVVQGDLKMVGAQAVRAQVTATAAETRKLKTAAAEVGTGARTGAQGLQQLGREADGAAARIREATAASAMAEAQNAALARSNVVASGAVGNLTAQFNDIFTMLAAGQNPLQLAIQQGMQITQVFGNQGAASALEMAKNAVLGMLSPMNLMTIGGIAAGAAMVQWLMSAGEEAVTLEEAMEQLSDRTDSFGEAIDRARSPTQDLIADFGEASTRIRVLLLEMAELEGREAARSARNTAATLKEQLGIYDDAASGVGSQKNLAELFDLSIWSRESRREINSVIAAFNAMEGAGTLEEQIAAAEALRDRFQQVALSSGEVTAAEEGTLRSLGQIILDLTRQQELQRQLTVEVAGTNALVAATAGWISEATGELSGFVEGMFNSADAGRALNIEGFQIGGWLGSAIGLASGLAAEMWNAAAGAAAARAAAYDAELARTGQSSGPDSVRSRIFGGGAFTAPVRGAGLATPRASGGGGGGGGGGGAAAREETDAIERLIEKREQELALLRETDPVQREMLRNRELLATATDAQRQKIDEVTAALEREKAMQEASQFFEESAADWLKSVVTGSDSASEALDKLIQRLIDAGIEALLLGKGPLAGLFGVSGGIFDGIFGGKGGGGLLSGLFGGGKADGGPIYGRGGPRDDQVLIAASPGEFMVNARATARNRAMLEYINGGGDIGRFANGGAIGGGGGSGAVPGQIVISMPITVDARGATEGSAALIEAAIARRTPDIVQKAVAAVSRERARGRAA